MRNDSEAAARGRKLFQRVIVRSSRKFVRWVRYRLRSWAEWVRLTPLCWVLEYPQRPNLTTNL